MITAEEEKKILGDAYVPEHSIRLMTTVSGAEPFFVDGYLCCLRQDWLIIVGYPLEGIRTVRPFEKAYSCLVERFAPRRISVIAPSLPDSFKASCSEHETDRYFVLDLGQKEVRAGLKRAAGRALEQLSLERGHTMTKAHEDLSQEFIERVNPPLRVRKLLTRMPSFLEKEPRSVVLNAWDRNNELSAFYVVDLSAARFSTYVIGAHSKKRFVKHASDAIFLDMIELSREAGKEYIHLGLGVSKGIRQFKKKWGGVPTRDYVMCEITRGRVGFLDAVMSYLKMR